VKSSTKKTNEDIECKIKTEIARNAIKEGATVDFVKKITKLPVEIIKRLQAEIGKE
jgi:hypothetical protein